MDRLDKPSPGRKIWQLLALLAVIVIFPALSWWYLQSGLDYRRNSLGQLRQYGELPATLTQQPLVYGAWPDTLEGNMFIVGWLEPSATASQTDYGKAMNMLHDQFDAPSNIYFINILPQDSRQVDSLELQSFLDQYKLADPGQVLVLAPGQAGFSQLAQAFALPLSNDEAPSTPPRVALVDASLQIRAHYNLAEPTELRKLIEVTAMTLPRGEQPDIILRREKEK